MSEDNFTVDYDSPALEFWSRAITRVSELRKCVAADDYQRLNTLDFMEELAHHALSEEIARQEREEPDQQKS